MWLRVDSGANVTFVTCRARSVTVHTVQSLAFLHSVGKPAAVSDFCEMCIKGVNEHPVSNSRCVHLWITCFLLANVMFCSLFR